MAYFPFFIELSGRRGLIVGGGRVALRKVRKLLPYGPELTVAAPELLPELEAIPGVTALRRPFSPELLEGVFFAVAASGDRALNRRVADLCRARGILVNAADDRQACTFLFPALLREGPLSAGISTGGSSPSAAAWTRDRLRELLPGDFGALLERLESLRPTVKAAIPDQRTREAVFARLFSACLTAQRPLSPEEVQALLAEYAGGPEQ